MKTKRFLSMLLALLMVIATFPLVTFAEDTYKTAPGGSITVYKFSDFDSLLGEGNYEYDNDSKTITILYDLKFVKDFIFEQGGNTYILDLNGHILDMGICSLIHNGGNLTICDSVGGGGITSTGVPVLANSRGLVIKSGIFTSIGNNQAALKCTVGGTRISGGTFNGIYALERSSDPYNTDGIFLSGSPVLNGSRADIYILNDAMEPIYYDGYEPAEGDGPASVILGNWPDKHSGNIVSNWDKSKEVSDYFVYAGAGTQDEPYLCESPSNNYIIAEKPYDAWIGKTRVTRLNQKDVFGDGTVSFVNESTYYSKLTLKDFTYEGTAHAAGKGIIDVENYPYENYKNYFLVTVNLEGENTITGTGNTSYGILGGSTKGAFSVNGTGSLEISGCAYGIYTVAGNNWHYTKAENSDIPTLEITSTTAATNKHTYLQPNDDNYKVTLGDEISRKASGNIATQNVKYLKIEKAPLLVTISITNQPVGTTTFTEGSITGSLTAAGTVTNGSSETPDYQWYSNTINNNYGGTLISGATSPSFEIPKNLTAGTYYYYCTLSADDAETRYTSVAKVIVAEVEEEEVIPTHTHNCGHDNCPDSWENFVVIDKNIGATTNPSLKNGNTYYFVLGDNMSNTGFNPSLGSGTATVYLCLNGHELNGMTIPAGVTMYICDCADEPGLVSSRFNVYGTAMLGSGSYSLLRQMSDTAVVHVYGPITMGDYADFSTERNKSIILDNADAKIHFSSQPYTAIKFKPYGTGVFATGWKSSFNSSYKPVSADAAYEVEYNSATGEFSFVRKATAQAPAIDTNVSVGESSYDKGGNAQTLNVAASVADGGTLTYQWYKSETNSTTNGTAISGATGASYTPSTSVVGTAYYYCVVTNTNNGATTSVATNVAKVTINEPIVLHTHCICGEIHNNVGDHTEEEVQNFTAVSTYAELVAAATNGGNYYLANDIEINSTITVTGDLTLCLNGHTLKNTDDNTRVINIDGGTLNLTDCGSTGTITGGSLTSGVSYNNFGAGVKVTDGTFNMYGGIISGNTTHYGGGVSVEYGSTFTLYDGTIRSNTATGGGGVYSQGTFTMHGGEISGNTAASGGGVHTGGTFTMHGGEITGNTANYGGGVDANNRDTIIAGGSIINNTANESPSGGIYTNQPMTLSGTPVIYGNKYGDNDGSFDICKFWSEIRVTEDFAPTGSPIRVFVDLTCNDCVFLETADSGMDVENYIDYFENVSEFPLYKKDGKYYAGFAIIEEPTSENNYTVKVTSKVGLSSQWCEKVLVNKELTDSDMSFIMDGMYDTDSQSFTMPHGRLQGGILLNAGDKLIVSSQSEIEAMLDGAYPPAVERVGNTYTFTVTNTDAYMLMVFGDSGASVKLTKNGSDFVEVEGQTALTLDTTNLEEGEYKCKLVWDLGTDSTDDDIVTWSEVLTYTKPTCTITFASNGGSAVESKTCGYNQTISAPLAPTKEGFEFIAWYTDDALTTKWNFETPVTENKTLYAKWVKGEVSDDEEHVDKVVADGLNEIAKAEETDITLVVQVESAAEDDEEQTAIKGIIDAPGKFDFYDITLEKSTGGYVTDASDVIEIKMPYSFSRKTNIKVYRYHNGEGEELTQLEEKATMPYVDGKCYVDKTNKCIYIYSSKFSTYAVAYDAVKTTNVYTAMYYSVIFRSNGGNIVPKASVEEGTRVPEPYDPEKAGYTFDGWYSDKELTTPYNFSEKVTKDLILYAKWERMNGEADEKEEVKDDGKDKHDCPSASFSDLDTTKWYHEDVDYVLDNKIMLGTSDTEFDPEGSLTRGMLVTILYRSEGEPATNRSIPFSDVDMGAYYANAVIWAQQVGIVKGISETEYAPDMEVTREQLATIMFRYAAFKGMDAVTLEENLGFNDASDISDWAVAAMNWGVGKNYIFSRTEGEIAPGVAATRAEIAAFIHRFSKEVK